jgi:uncharacterized SAM-binding protein YcdF (DUF218 family)
MIELTYLEPALPLLLVLIVMGSVAVGRPRWQRIGRLTVVSAAIALFLWCWPPVATVLRGTLEWWYPSRAEPARDMQAIVVLSSTFNAPEPPRPRTIPFFDTYVRIRCASWLYQNGWELPVVVSGGQIGDRVMAAIMKEALIKEGVPASQIWSESESRSTYENALFSARLLLPRGMRKIVLVTEAFHMLRAERCFRKAGFDVSTAPCGYTVFEGRLNDWIPNSSAIKQNDSVLHEWLGLAWYRLSGKI